MSGTGYGASARANCCGLLGVMNGEMDESAKREYVLCMYIVWYCIGIASYCVSELFLRTIFDVWK